MDVELKLDPVSFLGDLSISGGQLVAEEGLRTAVVMSLFSDARAADEDELPVEDGDRRGWWGDAHARVDGDRIGSRLWLLSRSKRTEATAARVKQYCEQALAWMVEDGIVSAVAVLTEVQGAAGRPDIAVRVSLSRPGLAPAEFRFQNLWDAEAARAVH